MHLSDLSWTDARDREVDTALLPVGSTEQHGPHAPLGTDFLTAAAIAERGAAECASEVVVAPTIPVGVAEEHRHFDGTLWVTEDAFRAYVGDVLRSLGDLVEQVVVVNGHGGNTDALREICARVTRDGEVDATPFTWFDAVDPDVPLGHGGAVETSLVQYLRADLVHEDRFAAAREGMGDAFGDWIAGTNLAYDFREFTESGNVGDPSAASPELGEELLAEAATGLRDVVETVRERERS
jgi:creatinine amidohydrolase